MRCIRLSEDPSTTLLQPGIFTQPAPMSARRSRKGEVRFQEWRDRRATADMGAMQPFLVIASYDRFSRHELLFESQRRKDAL